MCSCNKSCMTLSEGLSSMGGHECPSPWRISSTPSHSENKQTSIPLWAPSALISSSQLSTWGNANHSWPLEWKESKCPHWSVQGHHHLPWCRVPSHLMHFLPPLCWPVVLQELVKIVLAILLPLVVACGKMQGPPHYDGQVGCARERILFELEQRACCLAHSPTSTSENLHFPVIQRRKIVMVGSYKHS